MEQVRTWVLTAGAVVLALLILATLVRAVLGPRFTDRIVAVNVISTLVIAELMVLSGAKLIVVHLHAGAGQLFRQLHRHRAYRPAVQNRLFWRPREPVYLLDLCIRRGVTRQPAHRSHAQPVLPPL